ncbi:hypothetical protein EYF80_001363 [Liparis tanakae]|uniref:t-SNARE coiled-coil homology domain-containing protein n=1 Tax=Liparis tanakae TaxID=230148 RepID=A0A4Z2JEH3_9TELE|nr:hypothetical protein EYF80_001363 [Liparis tanakae]
MAEDSVEDCGVRDIMPQQKSNRIVTEPIEDYIQTTSSNVESANQELAKANQYQRFNMRTIAGQFLESFMTAVVSVSPPVLLLY